MSSQQSQSQSQSQSYSFSSSSFTSSSNGGAPQTTAYAERTYGDDNGSTTERYTKQPGQEPFRETFHTGQDGRRLGGSTQGQIESIEDVTDADKEYAERIEDEYAKREGGA